MMYGFDIPWPSILVFLHCLYIIANKSISNCDIPLSKIPGSHQYSHIPVHQKNDNADPHILCTLLDMDSMCN